MPRRDLRNDLANAFNIREPIDIGRKYQTPIAVLHNDRLRGFYGIIHYQNNEKCWEEVRLDLSAANGKNRSLALLRVKTTEWAKEHLDLNVFWATAYSRDFLVPKRPYALLLEDLKTWRNALPESRDDTQILSVTRNQFRDIRTKYTKELELRLKDLGITTAYFDPNSELAAIPLGDLARLISMAQEAKPLSRVEQLHDFILTSENKVWNGKQALEAYKEMGWDCDLSRARTNLKKVSERFPGTLVADKKKPFTWRVIGHEVRSSPIAE